MFHVLSNLQKDANSPFNTTEDSGINAKFVNVVYDALLNTVSRKVEVEFMFDNIVIISSAEKFFREANYLRKNFDIGAISEESLKTYLK